jgi:hypothetical protein
MFVSGSRIVKNGRNVMMEISRKKIAAKIKKYPFTDYCKDKHID